METDSNTSALATKPLETDVLVIQKPKKFVLPRSYLRQKHAQADDFADVLHPEKPLLSYVTSLAVTDVASTYQVPQSSVITECLCAPTSSSKHVEKQKRVRKPNTASSSVPVSVTSDEKREEVDTTEPIPQEDKPVKEKRPTAYNIFVKSTLLRLAKSHEHMTSKERFSLAIVMWNEHKALQDAA